MAAAARRRLLDAAAASGAAVFFLLALGPRPAPATEPAASAPAALSDKARAEALSRDIALLEPLHMFTIHHCTAWRCGMGGSNSLPESDRQPLEWCPECTAKICWACRADPVERYRKMAAFLAAHDLGEQAQVCRASIAALQGRPATRPAPATRARSG